MTGRTTKGAIVAVNPLSPIPTVIAFQYNPESVTRTLQPQASGDEGARSEAMRLKGPPRETIKFDAEIDATDQLEKGSAVTEELGVHPQLAALEMLVYPSSAVIVANTALLATGTVEVVPPVGPFTVLVWGYKRVLPVRVTEFGIVEEFHDHKLNPIRARVSLGLRVLTYDDLSITHPGYYLFMAHHIAKEGLAAVGSISDVKSVLGGDVRLF